MSSDQFLALCASIAGVAALLCLAVGTPWRTLPGGPQPEPPDPSRDFTPEQIARGRSLSEAARLPALVSLVVSLAVGAVLGLTPAGAHVVGAVRGGWARQVVLGGLLVVLIGAVATLPFSAWSETVHRRFGLSVQTWPRWWADQAKAFAVSATLLLAALVGLYALVRAVPGTGWAIAAGVAALAVVVLSFVAPVLLEPLFLRCTPLQDGPLRDTLLALAARDGVRVRDVLVADASRRTTAVNAYVSGFGPSRRIVVFDTTLERVAPRDIRLVTAHELGHVRRHDVLFGTLTGAFGAASAVCVTGLLLRTPALLRLAGATDDRDPRSLALLMFLVTAAAALSTPARTLVSRRVETRADVHALELTGDADGWVAMQRDLAAANIANVTPNRLLHAVFATHPSAPQRIALARAWGATRRPAA